jgi:hypothetical protein
MSEKKWFRPRLDDDKFIDAITIETVPRFKTSGMSGDEWRTSVLCIAYRKGRRIKERTVGDIAYAQQMMATNDWWTDDEAIPEPRMAEDLCDQPGCAEPWTVLYRRVKEGCGRCGSRRDAYEGTDYAQAFCERHAHRGDSSLSDSDDNYEPVIGAHPSEQVPRPEDESPSVFGNIAESRVTEFQERATTAEAERDELVRIILEWVVRPAAALTTRKVTDNE